MTEMTYDTLENLLERYGWKFQKTAEGKIVTGFQGLAGNFLLSFEIKENWLVVFTADYLPDVIKEKREVIYNSLLALNSEYPYVRFAAIPEGKIFIIADIPIRNNGKVDFDMFKLVMDLICEAADRFYPVLYEMITGNKVVPTDIAEEK